MGAAESRSDWTLNMARRAGLRRPDGRLALPEIDHILARRNMRRMRRQRGGGGGPKIAAPHGYSVRRTECSFRENSGTFAAHGAPAWVGFRGGEKKYQEISPDLRKSAIPNLRDVSAVARNASGAQPHKGREARRYREFDLPGSL